MESLTKFLHENHLEIYHAKGRGGTVEGLAGHYSGAGTEIVRICQRYGGPWIIRERKLYSGKWQMIARLRIKFKI